jgi:hypothetical protein
MLLIQPATLKDSDLCFTASIRLRHSPVSEYVCVAGYLLMGGGRRTTSRDICFMFVIIMTGCAASHSPGDGVVVSVMASHCPADRAAETALSHDRCRNHHDRSGYQAQR